MNSNGKTNVKLSMVHQNYSNIIKIQNQHPNQERQIRQSKRPALDDNSNPNISYTEEHYVYSTTNTMGTNEKIYQSNNKKNLVQMQRKQPALAGTGVMAIPSQQKQEAAVNRNGVGTMILKTRAVEMVGADSAAGQRPRNDSGNSKSGGGTNGNSLFGPNAGNMTSTSQTCNQSFHFGHSQQLGQALVTGGSRSKSKNRGGSSGSN